MTSPTPSRLADERLADEQVHAMCAYLRTGSAFICVNCPASIDTPYGKGQQGCYGIAEETLLKAREIFGRAAETNLRRRIEELQASEAKAWSKLQEICDHPSWDVFPDEPDVGFRGHQQCKECGKCEGIDYDRYSED